MTFAEWALLLSVVVAVLAIPLFWLLRMGGRVPPLLGLVVLVLAIGGAVGAFGRLADADAAIDSWVRIIVIATRVAAGLAMTYDIFWLWKARTR